MRPPGDAGAGRGSEQLDCALKHLHQEPQSYEPYRRQFEEEWDDNERNHHDHAREWEHAHIGAEHAGDGAGGDQRRHLGAGVNAVCVTEATIPATKKNSR